MRASWWDGSWLGGVTVCMCKYAHVHTCAHQACIPWAALALESKPCTAPGRPLCSWLAVSPPCRCDPSWPAGTRRPAPWGRGSVLDRQWEVSRNPGVIGWGAGSIGAHAPLPHPRPPSPSPCSLLLRGKDLRSGSQRDPWGEKHTFVLDVKLPLLPEAPEGGNASAGAHQDAGRLGVPGQVEAGGAVEEEGVGYKEM